MALRNLFPPAKVANNGITTDAYLDLHNELLTESYLIAGLEAEQHDHHMWTRCLARVGDLGPAGIAAIKAAPPDPTTTEILDERLANTSAGYLPN